MRFKELFCGKRNKNGEIETPETIDKILNEEPITIEEINSLKMSETETKIEKTGKSKSILEYNEQEQQDKIQDIAMNLYQMNPALNNKQAYKEAEEIFTNMQEEERKKVLSEKLYKDYTPEEKEEYIKNSIKGIMASQEFTEEKGAEEYARYSFDKRVERELKEENKNTEELDF